VATRDPRPAGDRSPGPSGSGAAGTSAEPRVIELDVSAEWEPPRRRPVIRTSGARLPGARLPGARLPGARWLAVVAGVLAVLATMGGSAPARSLDPVFRLSADVRQLVAAPGLLVALVQSVGTDPVVRAYRLGDFSLAWQTSVEGNHIWAMADSLVIEQQSAQGTPELHVLDAATGRERWHRRQSSALGGIGDLMVLLEGLPTGDSLAPEGRVAPAEVGTNDGAESFLGVDRRTGEVRWAAQLRPGASMQTASSPDRGELTALIEVDRDGGIRARDPATGALRSSARLPPGTDPDTVMVLHDLVFAASGGDPSGGDQNGGDQHEVPPPMRAYDLADGRLRWERAASPTNVVTACGRWICMAGAGTEMVDPATGRTRWRADVWHGDGVDVWHGYNVVADRTVVVRGRPDDFPPERSEAQATVRPTLAVIDMPTGRVQHEVQGWEPTSDVLPGGRQLVGQADRQGHARLAALDLASGRVLLIGTVTVWSGGVDAEVECLLLERHAACQAGLEMAVWRLPPGPDW